MIYDGQGIDLGYRIDLIVQGTVIVEIKCVASINPVHQAQLLSYIRRSGRKPGRLINSTSTTSATASNAWSTARVGETNLGFYSVFLCDVCGQSVLMSRLRHIYQQATLRYGSQAFAIFSISFGLGSLRFL